MPPRQPGPGLDHALGHNRQPAGQNPAAQPFGRRLSGPLPPLAPKEQLAVDQDPWPLQPSGDTAANAGWNQTETNMSTSDAEAHRRSPRRSWVGACLYGTLGFAAGVAFWHAVGFWNLVHEAVFSGPRLEASARVAPPRPGPAPPRSVGFDEQQLRHHATRPSAPGQAGISTGSIGPAYPNSATQPVRPQAHPSPKTPHALEEPVTLTGPGGISWQPAVKEAR